MALMETLLIYCIIANGMFGYRKQSLFLFLDLTKNYRSATLCLYVSNKFLVLILFLAFKIYKKLLKQKKKSSLFLVQIIDNKKQSEAYVELS